MRGIEQGVVGDGLDFECGDALVVIGDSAVGVVVGVPRVLPNLVFDAEWERGVVFDEAERAGVEAAE